MQYHSPLYSLKLTNSAVSGPVDLSQPVALPGRLHLSSCRCPHEGHLLGQAATPPLSLHLDALFYFPSHTLLT